MILFLLRRARETSLNKFNSILSIYGCVLFVYEAALQKWTV